MPPLMPDEDKNFGGSTDFKVADAANISEHI